MPHSGSYHTGKTLTCTVSPICYTKPIQYEIETTHEFDQWINNLKDKATVVRLYARFERIKLGNFGDHKRINENLLELRFFFGGGIRIY